MEMTDKRYEPSILLVEDDPLTREQLGDLLNAHFRHVSCAENGEQGLKMYQETRPDIIITDLLMPIMDGLEMARRIRSLNPAVQIVVITAYNEITSSAAIRQITSNFALKPIDMDMLLDIINKCTGNIRAGGKDPTNEFH